MISTRIIIALAILVAALRPFMPQRHGFTLAMSYEAVAHIIVGMLIAGWILADQKKPFWLTLVVITIIEVICGMRP